MFRSSHRRSIDSTSQLRPLTRQQVADLTGLSVRTIDRLIASGELPARKYKRAVRIDPEGFRRYQETAGAKLSTSVGNTQLSGSVQL